LGHILQCGLRGSDILLPSKPVPKRARALLDIQIISTYFIAMAEGVVTPIVFATNVRYVLAFSQTQSATFSLFALLIRTPPKPKAAYYITPTILFFVKDAWSCIAYPRIAYSSRSTHCTYLATGKTSVARLGIWRFKKGEREQE
jgi:hypothetical protein